MKIQSSGTLAMAVVEAQVGGRQVVQRAARSTRVGLDQHVLDLAAVGAGVHAQRAADRAGNADQELQPGDAGVAPRAGDVDVERAGAGDDVAPVGLDAGEAAAQADDDARHAAVAHQQVGADADHRHRHVGGLGARKAAQVVAVGRAEQHFGRAADAEPGDARQVGARSGSGRAPAGRRSISPCMPAAAITTPPRRPAERAQLVRQRVGPGGDGAGAEADTTSPAWAMAAISCGQRVGVVERRTSTVAVGAQARDQCVAVDAAIGSSPAG